MTNPTLEQVEAARAEYDRSEDMCAALVAAAGAAPQEPHAELLREARGEFLRHSNDVWALDLVERLANALADLVAAGVTPPAEVKVNAAVARSLRVWTKTIRSELEATRGAGINLGRDYLHGIDSALRQAEDHAARIENDLYGDGVAAPLQVDEAKLAEVLLDHAMDFEQRPRPAGPKGSGYVCECGLEILEPRTGPGIGWWHRKHLANAVSEWLRGGGR